MSEYSFRVACKNTIDANFLHPGYIIRVIDRISEIFMILFKMLFQKIINFSVYHNFVIGTGISNQQRYSFQGLVDASLMLLLAGTILVAVYYLFRPVQPEQNLLRILRRFFHGCAQVTGGFAMDRPSLQEKGRRLRKRHFESMILPAPAKIQAAQTEVALGDDLRAQGSYDAAAKKYRAAIYHAQDALP